MALRIALGTGVFFPGWSWSRPLGAGGFAGLYPRSKQISPSEGSGPCEEQKACQNVRALEGVPVSEQWRQEMDRCNFTVWLMLGLDSQSTVMLWKVCNATCYSQGWEWEGTDAT